MPIEHKVGLFYRSWAHIMRNKSCRKRVFSQVALDITDKQVATLFVHETIYNHSVHY